MARSPEKADADSCRNPKGRGPLARMPRRFGETSAPARQFGIDLARKGGDESVIVRRHGMTMANLRHFSHTEPVEIIRMAMKEQLEHQWDNEGTIFVPDSTGVGQGIRLRPLSGRRCPVPTYQCLCAVCGL